MSSLTTSFKENFSTPGRSSTVFGTSLRLLALGLVDAFALWLLLQLVADGIWFLAAVVIVITLGLNLFYLRPELYPFRWFSPGLALMILMVAYPTIFTIYVAFTNYSDGHLLTREQALQLFLREVYLPEDAASYSWTAFRSEDETQYALWLTDEQGNAFLARPGEPLIPATEAVEGVGPLDEDGIPESIEGYEQLNRITAAADRTLPTLRFGEEPDLIGISGRNAGRFQQKYVFDADQNALIDQQTGTVYTAVNGTFTSPEGEQLSPGFYVPIGVENFTRFVTSPALRGPLTIVFIWTIIHALGTVFITFVLGLGMALLLNSDLVPARKVFRSLVLIPYAMPAFISVLIWRGLLSEQLGYISVTMRDVFGWAPAWFTDATWARAGILLIQLWLGFPYMTLICTGALQSISTEIYEAAEVDGANALQRFWNLTLPLLLVAIGPLLIASFAFNFNNFTVLYLYNEGGPPIPGTTTPAGWTDILITYTYRLAFASGRGADLGYASAITIIIFIIVAAITLFNFRFTRTWEEVSQNV
jgi:ABC-type sugar transport system permease subunit